MTDRPPTRRRQIAIWRYEQIGPLVDPDTPIDEKQAHWVRLKSTPVEWPQAARARRAGRPPRVKPVSETTAIRWCDLYLAHGLAGLEPRGRLPRASADDAKRAEVCAYAIGLLYENPQRSLTQLLAYLTPTFEACKIVRSTLHRDLVAHPAYAGVLALRKGGRRKRRDRYQTKRPHQIWQIDGKGPFEVRIGARRARVRVLSIVEAFSRKVLVATISIEEDHAGVVDVLRKAIALYGLPERVQMDRHATYDSWAIRDGLASLGVHRKAIKPRNPAANGLVEAYHRSLDRWFVKELPHQEVKSPAHLQDLLTALIEVLYNTHRHRVLRMSPAEALNGRLSDRRASASDLARAFWVERTFTSHAKNGLVALSRGVEVQVPTRLFGKSVTIRFDPVDPKHAELLDRDRVLPLKPYQTKDPCEPPPVAPTEERGVGQLQKLVDQFRGASRPNAEPGFGLPEVFTELSPLLGHRVPESEAEANAIRRFYQAHGPLPAEPFRAAIAETRAALGHGRALAAYLDHLARLVRRARPPETTA